MTNVTQLKPRSKETDRPIKRKDLTQEAFKNASQGCNRRILWQFQAIPGLASQIPGLSSLNESMLDGLSQRMLSHIWEYASLDGDLIYGGGQENVLHSLIQEIQTVDDVVFTPIGSLSRPNIDEMEDWALSTQFACRVALARIRLDTCCPLSPGDLALISDLSIDDIEFRIQNGKLAAFANAPETMIDATQALAFLIRENVAPYPARYDLDKFRKFKYAVEQNPEILIRW